MLLASAVEVVNLLLSFLKPSPEQLALLVTHKLLQFTAKPILPFCLNLALPLGLCHEHHHLGLWLRLALYVAMFLILGCEASDKLKLQRGQSDSMVDSTASAWICKQAWT